MIVFLRSIFVSLDTPPKYIFTCISVGNSDSLELTCQLYINAEKNWLKFASFTDRG
jgi:hypothetical protein